MMALGKDHLSAEAHPGNIGISGPGKILRWWQKSNIPREDDLMQRDTNLSDRWLVTGIT